MHYNKHVLSQYLEACMIVIHSTHTHFFLGINLKIAPNSMSKYATNFVLWTGVKIAS